MLSQWMKWTPRDVRDSPGFPTKEALRYALRKAGLNAVAEDLPPGMHIIYGSLWFYMLRFSA